MNKQQESSFWVRPNTPRDGFTQYAAAEMRVIVPVGDVGDLIVAQRQHRLSALIGLQQQRQTVGVMHANVVSNN